MIDRKLNDSPLDGAVKVIETAARVRRSVLEKTLQNKGGYLSQACSSADILATLYVRLMNLGPSTAPWVPRPFAGAPGADNRHSFTGAGYNGPKAPDLDRFIFSPVHYALVLYATLIEVGRLAPEALEQFNRDGSTLELIGAEHSPGHEVTAGSLAQAISQAGGMALARKLRAETGRVWVFMSDGEFQEGQTWEALAAATFHKLDNLRIFVDVNGHQCDGRMDGVMGVEPLLQRLLAFGVDALEVDGHDVEALAAAGTRVKPGCPLVVLARTDPCRGLELLRQRPGKLHYIRFRDEAEYRAYELALAGMEEEIGRPAWRS